MIKLWHRIAVVNDYKNSLAFINFYRFEDNIDIIACEVKGTKERVLPTDGIGIFINYNRVEFVKSKALANFDLTIREQFLEAAHYTNLQPLWELDNIKKSNK